MPTYQYIDSRYKDKSCALVFMIVNHIPGKMVLYVKPDAWSRRWAETLARRNHDDVKWKLFAALLALCAGNSPFTSNADFSVFLCGFA